ncbi:phenylacetate--CoA ligase family protein [bacterium]|nr:MAG: phenylacetate--CoA ligase family protein [bacterium]
MDNWENLSFLSAKELRELQNRKLHYFVNRRLYPFSPYYQKLFLRHKINPRSVRTVKDLEAIPFTKKEDLFPARNNSQSFLDFILKPDEALIRRHWPKSKLLYLALLKALKGKEHIKQHLEKEYRPIFLTATTGTANQPVSFLYTAFDIENLRVSGYRLLEVFGTLPDDRAVNLFPYAPHLAFWQTVFAGLAHNRFLLSTGGGKVLGTQGNIEAIAKVRPNMLIGVPSYIYHIVRSAGESGKDFSFVKKIILGASAVPSGFKEKLSGLLKGMGAKDVYVMGTYGFTEAKCAWGECPTQMQVSSGYHTYPDKEIFEVIDPETGEVKKEGEGGELVYTSIDARGSCVFRYRTGDLVKGGITYEPCPYCKRTVPRVSSEISRASDIRNLTLSKVKGTLVNFSLFGEILEGEPGVEEWQVELKKKDNDPYEVDELYIYLSIRNDANPQAIREALKNKIHSATEVTPNDIAVLSRKEMLERVEMEVSNKVKRFVDRRP